MQRLATEKAVEVPKNQDATLNDALKNSELNQDERLEKLNKLISKIDEIYKTLQKHIKDIKERLNNNLEHSKSHDMFKSRDNYTAALDELKTLIPLSVYESISTLL